MAAHIDYRAFFRELGERFLARFALVCDEGVSFAALFWVTTLWVANLSHLAHFAPEVFEENARVLRLLRTERFGEASLVVDALGAQTQHISLYEFKKTVNETVELLRAYPGKARLVMDLLMLLHPHTLPEVSTPPESAA